MSTETKDRTMVEIIKASLENLSNDELEETADALLKETKKRKNK